MALLSSDPLRQFLVVLLAREELSLDRGQSIDDGGVLIGIPLLGLVLIGLHGHQHRERLLQLGVELCLLVQKSLFLLV